MLELPGKPHLDKDLLVGACAKLPITVDAEKLRGEVAALPSSVWSSTGGRVGVHMAAQALFLRGHAPAEGDLPITDRPPLAQLPYVKSIITALIPAPVQRCLLARLPAGDSIAPHIDRAPYFSQTIRIHVAVETHDLAYMSCADQIYVMRPGEVWSLNNCARHGVWNAHPTLARTHLICDFLLSDELIDLLARADRTLGTQLPHVQQHIRAARASAAGG